MPSPFTSHTTVDSDSPPMGPHIAPGLSPPEPLLGKKPELHSWQRSTTNLTKKTKETKNLSAAAKDWHFSLSAIVTGDPPPPSTGATPEWVGGYTYNGMPAHLIRPRAVYMTFDETYPGPNELKGKRALIVHVAGCYGLLERVYILNGLQGVDVTSADGTEIDYINNNKEGWLEERGVSKTFYDAWEHLRSHYTEYPSRLKDRVFGEDRWLDISFMRAFMAGLPPAGGIYYFEKKNL
ncbi:hypothetical protein DM02DRAFT_651850 [Periconia macrospinosa]|uniref:Uncharacterized protein n=1 Tax=Periconia macrospinosa TaxID=97972 RepID=A0A2V1E110_9PLEO|nr:hypothetical protein DM02DRAFT_651850 [Periconia macrospinosa]